MAIVDFPLCEVPHWPYQYGTSALSLTTAILLDAAGEKYGAIVGAPKDGTISKIAFRSSSFTSGGDVDVRLETVDAATGDPSGTLLAANTNGTQAIAAANTWYTKTLTAGAVVTRGQRLAVSIHNVSGNYAITAVPAAWSQLRGFPYVTHFTAAWVKQTFGPLVAFEYDDGSYAPLLGVMPFSDQTSFNIGTGSSPNEVGVKFTLAAGVRVCGYYVYPDLDADADVVLYDSDGTTALLTQSLDKDIRMGTNAGYLVGKFSTQATLAANTAYRLALKATTASTLNVPVLIMPALALMGATPGGATWMLTSRTGAGAWTETTTRLPPLGLILDGIDVPAGTSGSHFIGG